MVDHVYCAMTKRTNVCRFFLVASCLAAAVSKDSIKSTVMRKLNNVANES